MIKLLILVKKYPTESEPYALTYVHSRCIEYKKRGYQLDVLSFETLENYQYQGINVVTRTNASMRINSYTHIISHAPNLRQHLPFLMKYCTQKEKIFFLHGHEVLIKNKHYPPAYDYMQRNKIKSAAMYLLNNAYDKIKTRILRHLIAKTRHSKFVLVSSHLKEISEKDLSTTFPQEKTFIIHNCVNEVFISHKYNVDAPKKNDFVTIRQLDNSTYCVDVVHKLATDHPHLTFTIYGIGSFFQHNKLPQNVTLINSFFKHEQLLEILSSHRAALMPTRHDSQGVMSCEMATYGIPLITSNIKVCKEIFSEMPNVALICNDSEQTNLGKIMKTLQENLASPNKTKFSAINTIDKELNIITNTP